MNFTIWHPELYHGRHRKRGYFEGWYFKQVKADLSESWSFIPGISRGEKRGEGYSEKDWGSSMPNSWIWIQSNNFKYPGDSFLFSLASIPWLGSSFTGFLCVGSLGGRLLREATWTAARLLSLSVEENRVSAALGKGKDRIEIEASRAPGAILRAPVKGLLTRRITESVDAILRLHWVENGRLVFEGEARRAGLEIVGDDFAG